jgi:hypothetical protein
LLSFGLWSGRLPAAWLRFASTTQAPRPEPKPCACEKPAPLAAGAAATPAVVAAPTPLPGAAATAHEIEAARYPVCEREETAPILSRLRLDKAGPELWALHCGPSVHIFSIESDGEHLRPLRIARLDAQSYNPAQAPRAVPVSAADIDGDGRGDLLAPVLLLDRAGAPSGGALYLLRQRAEGGFAPAARLLDLAPGGVVAATLDAQPGADLALLQLHDAHVGRPNELWLIHGGPAPLRFAQRDAGTGAVAIAAVDLDRDGVDDVAAASAVEGRVRLWLSSRGGLVKAEPIVLELAHARELLAADLDGDGQRDLIVTGDSVWFVLARKDSVPEAKSVTGSEGLRDVQLEDVNADGKIDVVGYLHPALIACTQAAGFAFTKQTLATLQGELGLLSARVAQLDADGQPDLVAVTVSHERERQVELTVASDLANAAVVRLGAQAQTFRDVALMQHFVLP